MQGRSYILIAIALNCAFMSAEAAPNRPDLNSAKPIATCKLQTLQAAAEPRYEQPAVLYTLQRPAEDPLTNYERTPLGDWQMRADAPRDDPWLRLLLIGPKRPVVIDLAVFIDGKSFRDKREAWIDDVFAAAKAEAPKPAEAKATGNNETGEAGTNPPDAASEGDASPASPAEASPPQADESTEEPAEEESATDAEVEKRDDAEKALPAVAAKARQAPTMRDRLINYLATNGDGVERDEIHWLIAEWGAGPAVVVLGPSLSWQRASLAPLLSYLDQDIDGSLSSAEIAQADTMLKRADVDANDVLEVSELRRVSSRPPAPPKVAGHSLIVPLDDNTDWDALAANLSRIYGAAVNATTAPSSGTIQETIARGDAMLDGTQLRQLCDEPADVSLRIDFGSASDDKKDTAAVSVLSIGPNLSASAEAVAATNDVISVDIGGDVVEISAAQSASNNAVDAGASQLAVGAVIDGNPLERLLDGDQDGRFTLRERQQLGGLLAALDRNEDGQVASDEIPVPIRLAVTIGPQVHQLLASPTGSARTIAPREAAPAPPDWFVSMDKNNDRDLSSGEFLGTKEQFRQFDTDADGLLSVAEARKLNAGQ